MAIAPEGFVGQHEVPHRHGMVTTDPVPPIAAIAAELGLAAVRIEYPVLRTEAQIAMADIEGGPCPYRLDFGSSVHQATHILATAQGRPPRRLARDGDVLADGGEIPVG